MGQSIVTSAATERASDSVAKEFADDEARRRQMLAALDIDVWTARREQPTQSLAESGLAERGFADSDLTDRGSAASVSSAESSGAPPRSGGPSAARALLEESQAAAGSSLADKSVVAKPLAVESAEHATSVSAPQPAVNLWCLSGPFGVLLTNFTGLSPHAQHLLRDVFQSAMRIAEGASSDPAQSGQSVQKVDGKSSKKLAVQQLRFNWPPADNAAGLGEGASTSRALRGFLSRALQDKPSAFVLYAAPELAELLAEAHLPLAPERLIYTGDPEELLADSAAKRALWQTLNTL